MVVAQSAPASATEPAAPNPFSENGLLTAARGAAASSDTRPVNIGIPPPDELRVLEARRDAELKRLTEKLRRAEARGPATANSVLATPSWSTDVAAAPVEDPEPAQRSALGMRDEAEKSMQGSPVADETRGHATVLMVLAPRGDHGARDRSADPILCMMDGCYVSNGVQAPATYHSFRESLSLSGRLGRGAGDCNNSLTCIFRNIDLGGAAASMVQPFDLKLLRVDRREQSEITADSSCRVIDGQLSCSRPVRTQSYTMWVVPEHVAREIGPEALANAMSSGLRTSRTAELPWVKP